MDTGQPRNYCGNDDSSRATGRQEHRCTQAQAQARSSPAAAGGCHGWTGELRSACRCRTLASRGDDALDPAMQCVAWTEKNKYSYRLQLYE
uniref:Uncharacterized protein n=1 Tax=Oryza sativa subsp. japonica TaxID=39947 RepID=Q5Z6N7_ORYSJ|nr:hypothetical protein [Oryza sativa Japonica Group]